METTQEIVSEPPKNGPPVFRKLRIAWSVAWGLAAVLLIVLWVRSYWRKDTLALSSPSELRLAVSLNGEFEVMQVAYIDDRPDTSSWDVRTEPMLADKEAVKNRFSFNRGVYDNEFTFTFPQWCPVLILAMLTTAPWVPWSVRRFSLRTLLIATTLVAVVLGLVVWAVRQ